MLVTYPDRRNLSANPCGTYATLHQLGSITPVREHYTPWEVV